MYIWEADLEQMCSESVDNTINTILLFILLKLPVFWYPGIYKFGMKEIRVICVYVYD